MQKRKQKKVFDDINFQRDSIAKLVRKLALPTMAVMLLNGLYNVVDSLVVGRGISVRALASLGIVYPVQLLLFSLGLGIGLGAATLSHRALYSKDMSMAKKILGNTFSLSLLISVLVMVLGLIYQNHILEILGIIPELVPQAKEYLITILLGSPIIIVTTAMIHLVRAEGRPNLSLAILLVAALLNMILSPVFVFVFKWGMIGTALATTISYFVASIILLVFFCSERSLLRLSFSDFDIELFLARGIFKAAFPSFFRNGGIIAMLIVVNLLIRQYAPAYTQNAFAGFAISYRLILLASMLVSGFLKGIQPVLSYNYGISNMKRVRDIMRVSNIWAILIVSPFFFLFAFIPKEIISLFVTGEFVIGFGADILRPLTIALPLGGLFIVVTGFFQSIGRVVPSLLLSMARFLLLKVPLLLLIPYLMSILNGEAYRGIWYAFPITDLLLTIIAIFWLNSEMKRLRIYDSKSEDASEGKEPFLNQKKFVDTEDNHLPNTMLGAQK